jgi:ubiquinone/menaquinone biosynthesis C-methylase UbiE
MIKNNTPLLFAILLMVMLAPAHAREENVNPGINRSYDDARFSDWVTTFENPGREVFDRRQQVLEALALKPGMDVADIGAGTGFYSLLFASTVGPEGRVYAVDITEDFVSNIARRATINGLTNVHTILSTATDVKLKNGSIDLAFVCDTYHHFEYPQTMLASIRKALRKGGELVIIDYRVQAGIASPWVMSHVRASRQTVISEVEMAGFRLVEDLDMLTQNFFLRFKKI